MLELIDFSYLSELPPEAAFHFGLTVGLLGQQGFKKALGWKRNKTQQTGGKASQQQ